MAVLQFLSNFLLVNQLHKSRKRKWFLTLSNQSSATWLTSSKETKKCLAWEHGVASIFQRQGSNEPIKMEVVPNMLQSVGGDLAETSVDPGLKQDLDRSKCRT